MLLFLLLSACGPKHPAELDTCIIMPNDLVTMASCGTIMVAYQDLSAPAAQGPIAFDAFNEGLVEGLTGKATGTPVVKKQAFPFVVNGEQVPGRYMTVSWDEGTTHREMSGYSAGLYEKKSLRLGACFGLLDAGSERPCEQMLPWVMAHGLKRK